MCVCGYLYQSTVEIKMKREGGRERERERKILGPWRREKNLKRIIIARCPSIDAVRRKGGKEGEKEGKRERKRGRESPGL